MRSLRTWSHSLVPIALAVLAWSPRAVSAGEPRPVTQADGALISSLLATAAQHAAATHNLDVLTTEDVKKSAAVEADRQLAGCSPSDCIGEIAQAMGARAVLYGSVGRLGDDVVVTLNLFDAPTAKALGRTSIKGADVNAAAASLDAAVAELVAAAPKSDEKLRLLVLPLDVIGLTPAEEASGPSAMLVGGIVVAAVGAGALVGGGVMDFVATAEHQQAESAVTQSDAFERARTRDAQALVALALYLGGAVAALAGGALVGVDAMSSPANAHAPATKEGE